MGFLENYLICPASPERVNERVVRVVAAYVSLLTLAYLLTGWLFVIAILAADFWVRGYTRHKLSPLRGSARWLNESLLRIEAKPIPEAPKRFSARIGLFFCVAIVAASLAGFASAAFWIAIVLLACALLESLAGFCVGCHFYTLLVYLRKSGGTT